MTTTENTGNTGSNSDQAITDVDQAVKAAQARRTKAAEGSKPAAGAATAEAPKKRAKLTDAERVARVEKLNKDRADRKAKRDAERAAKNANKPAAAAPHMKKVEKAGQNLPALSEDATALFDEITGGGLPASDITKLAAHLAYHLRVQHTKASASIKYTVGQRVTAIGGDLRYLGKTGEITSAQRIRCLVKFEGIEREGYFFNSEVEPAAAEAEDSGADEQPETGEAAAPEGETAAA